MSCFLPEGWALVPLEAGRGTVSLYGSHSGGPKPLPFQFKEGEDRFENTGGKGAGGGEVEQDCDPEQFCGGRGGCDK